MQLIPLMIIIALSILLGVIIGIEYNKRSSNPGTISFTIHPGENGSVSIRHTDGTESYWTFRHYKQ